ncbi:hypothetical protein K490DRAFT_71391 [Saccharata proteae CBS 121410]|uniref:tRNA-splicing endonuclease subunit Sen15 domain-containing protein n=1 Tax=Saccharata proteae CBS 121410 TaxID=1314787 RepID=A0A9P4I161_9PEZI|nr:hypothetical protein K490DRAFT_71391 [Saccharata proteae CBS 121410]
MATVDTPPHPSALTTLIQSTNQTTPPTHTTDHHALALQVQHNLHHQHHWTSLRLHTHSSLNPSSPLPRPIISGLPPRRLYIHPDEQIDILKEDARRKKAGLEKMEVLPQREWVLPTQLNEKWSLRRMGGVFDGLGVVPPGEGGDGDGEGEGKWRMTKRVVMAVLEDDSTVVYYIVHDGLVKPRQN